jgi:hypothetical protein
MTSAPNLSSANPDNQKNAETNGQSQNKGDQQSREVGGTYGGGGEIQGDVGAGGEYGVGQTDPSTQATASAAGEYGVGQTPEQAQVENTVNKNDPTGTNQEAKGIGGTNIGAGVESLPF